MILLKWVSDNDEVIRNSGIFCKRLFLGIREYKELKNKIEKGKGGLDKVILVDTKEFDELLVELTKMTFNKAKIIE